MYKLPKHLIYYLIPAVCFGLKVAVLSLVIYRMFALEVEDMDEAITYLKSKNVVISMEPVNLGKSKRAEIKDPDGLTIELRQW